MIERAVRLLTAGWRSLQTGWGLLRSVRGVGAEWRDQRPTLGGVFLCLSGVIIGYVPLTMASSLLLGNFISAVGLLFAALVFMTGCFVLYRPDLSTELGVVGAVFSLLSLFGAMGGLFVGMFLGFVGGSYAFAWVPPEERDRFEAASDATDADSSDEDGSGGSDGGKTAIFGVVAALVVLAVLVYAPTPVADAATGTGTGGYRFPNQTQNGGFLVSTNSLASGFTATWERHQVTTDTSNQQGLSMAQFLVRDDLEIHDVTIRKNVTYDDPNTDYGTEPNGSIVLSIERGSMQGDPSLKINHSELYFERFASSNEAGLCTLGISFSNVWARDPYNWYPVPGGCNFEAKNVTMLAHSMYVDDLHGRNFSLRVQDGGFDRVSYNESTCSDGGSFYPGCSDS